MKTLKIRTYFKKIMQWLIIPFVIFALSTLHSCKKDEDLLEKLAKSEFTDEGVLNAKPGFEMYLSGLVYYFRDEWQASDKTYWTQFQNTDMYNFYDLNERPKRANWSVDFTSESSFAEEYWNWAYVKMIPMANNIIEYAEKSENKDIWDDDADKNYYIAEAKFYRAWTYNILANLFGDVPIIQKALQEPKYDFKRSPRKNVYELAKSDLLFASKWLPNEVDESKEGLAIKAAALHLLTEVYISLNKYDSAIISATSLIDDPNFGLMTNRFGSAASQPGDVFSDLFKEGNFNRSSGNKESILVWQIDENIEGGAGSYKRGNNFVRGFGPFIDDLSGGIYDTLFIKYKNKVNTPGVDTMGRGAGYVRSSNYTLYDIWQSNWNDMRNSKYNMRREFYFDNPKSSLYGQKWNPAIHARNEKDTARRVFAYSLKVEGPFYKGGDGDYKGRTTKDVYVMRLAETYLLRAEAYVRKGDATSLQKATDDINTIRTRSNADSALIGEIDLDYILDERARELMTEEPRTRTLIRMGNLVERVRLYDFDPVSRATIQDYNKFWPIPQSAIDANTGAILKQNPGY